MSKTDHARIPGTHRAGHTERAWRKDGYSNRLPTRPHLSLADEVTEGLQVAASLDLDEAYVQDCEFDYFVDERMPVVPTEEPLAEWEWTLLGDDTHLTYEAYVEAHERTPRLVWSSDEPDVDTIAERAWREQEREERREEEARYDHGYAGEWLTGTIAEAFPHGGFIIEGPSTYEPSGKASAHMRVYELAREVGIDTRHMVEYLRIFGEWVTSHTSYVALPVCGEILTDYAQDLREEYGERTAKKTWAQERAHWDAMFR